MFIIKKKYYLIIQNIKDISLIKIKKHNKFVIIYRNFDKKQNIAELRNFRTECRAKFVKFFVANDIKLASLLNADGLYLSSHNKSLKPLHLKNKFEIIGSAHNLKEIYLKQKQGCNQILLSKLFIVDYKINDQTLGIVKFNKLLMQISNKLIPLGGIKSSNLNKLKVVNSSGFALFSEVKKKPAKIFSRLF